MTTRSCTAELIVDIHKSSLQHLKEAKTRAQHTAQAAYYHQALFGSKARFDAFRAQAMQKPIVCDDDQSFPSEEQASTHIDNILEIFNVAKFAEFGVAPPAGQADTDALFPSTLATAVIRLGENSPLSCLHWEWDEELGEWVKVPNRDLIATDAAGVEIAPMHKEMSDDGATAINASLRIVLHVGEVLP